MAKLNEDIVVIKVSKLYHTPKSLDPFNFNHRYEYDFAEAKVIVNKNNGTWKFYEFDTDPIYALRDN